MNGLGFVCILVGLIAATMIWLTLEKIRSRRIIASSVYCLQSLVFLLLFITLLLLFSNLNTYSRLTFEQEIVKVQMTKIASQQFELKLIFEENNIETFELSGDEWQLDTRILKWKGWANLIGLDSYYQLDRLSGRYRSIEQANSSATTNYQISNDERGLSLWKLKRMMGKNLVFLDAYFGQSVFMPMRDSAEYQVSITQSGLVARPANEIANQALTAW